MALHGFHTPDFPDLCHKPFLGLSAIHKTCKHNISLCNRHIDLEIMSIRFFRIRTHFRRDEVRMKAPCVSRVCHRYMRWLNSTCARCSPLGRKSLAADENTPRALLHTECSGRVLSGPRSPFSPLPPLCSLCEKIPPSRVPDSNPNLAPA